MKAALLASYSAPSAAEVSWLKEERDLHKVDDAMANDVKEEATKSCNLRALGGAQMSLSLDMKMFVPEVERERVLMTLFRVIEKCGTARVSTKKKEDDEPVSLETLGSHGCWYLMKMIKKFRGTFHPHFSPKFDGWVSMACEEVISIEANFLEPHLAKLIRKVWDVMADTNYVHVTQKTAFNASAKKQQRKTRSDAGTSKKRPREVDTGVNRPPEDIPNLPP